MYFCVVVYKRLCIICCVPVARGVLEQTLLPLHYKTMPKRKSLGKECVSKNELRVMRSPGDKYFCKKEMQKVRYTQLDIRQQDYVNKVQVVVSQKKC